MRDEQGSSRPPGRDKATYVFQQASRLAPGMASIRAEAARREAGGGPGPETAFVEVMLEVLAALDARAAGEHLPAAASSERGEIIRRILDEIEPPG